MKFKSKFKVEDRWVGDGCPVFVIAEAGSNHDGSIVTAKKLIDAAAGSGADCVKFQSYSGPGLVNKREQPEVFDIIEKIKTPAGWLKKLAEHARKRGLVFLDTPFDEEQLAALEDIGVGAYKIASGDLTNIPFIRQVAKTKKPIFFSVGCGDMADVGRAVEAVREAGNNKLVLLHCIVSYPTKWEDANVAVMMTLQDAFGCPVGYSDHSPGDLVPVLAVADGACVIEKHFTFSRSLPGPDHPFAMEVHEMKEMIEKIRAVPAAYGSPVKSILECEKEEVFYARRGVYAAVDIQKGERITRGMLALLRPARGIEPAAIDIIVGRTARKNIPALSPVTWTCV